MNLSQKTALVTGAAKRVGRVIALELAHQGTHIVLHHRSSPKEANAVAKEIQTLGVQCHIVQADLSSANSIQKMLQDLDKKSLTVDILINSASLFYKTPPNDLNEKHWDDLINTNLKGPYLLSVELAKKMAKKSGGKIILPSMIGKG